MAVLLLAILYKMLNMMKKSMVKTMAKTMGKMATEIDLMIARFDLYVTGFMKTNHNVTRTEV